MTIFLTSLHNFHTFAQFCLLIGNVSHVSDMAHASPVQSFLDLIHTTLYSHIHDLKRAFWGHISSRRMDRFYENVSFLRENGVIICLHTGTIGLKRSYRYINHRTLALIPTLNYRTLAFILTLNHGTLAFIQKLNHQTLTFIPTLNHRTFAFIPTIKL